MSCKFPTVQQLYLLTLLVYIKLLYYRKIELCVLVLFCLILPYMPYKQNSIQHITLPPLSIKHQNLCPVILFQPVYLEKRQQVELVKSGWTAGDRQQEVTSRFIRLLLVFRLITTLRFPMAGTASPGSTPLPRSRIISAV